MFVCVVAVAKPPLCRITVTSQATDGVSAGPRFIASATTQDKFGSIPSGHTSVSTPPCGSDAAPWLVEAAPGQQIRFTLHDFGSAQRQSAQSPQAGRPGGTTVTSDKGGSSTNLGSYCYTYAVLREPPVVGSSSEAMASGAVVASRRYTVCGRRERRSVVYRSSGNAVEVRIMKQVQRTSKTGGLTSDDDEDDRAYFLLEYEGFSLEYLLTQFLKFSNDKCFTMVFVYRTFCSNMKV